MTPRNTACGVVALSALIAGVAVTALAPATAQEKPGPRDLSAMLESIRAEHGVPALGAALVTLDGVGALGTTGVRAAGRDEAVTTDDLWHLGSCTKAFTATLLGRLHDREQLDLETPLRKALPKLARKMHRDWRDVPLLQLLQNRGGAPGDVDPALWLKLRTTSKPPREARRLLAQGVLTEAPAYEPGTQNVYSNTGFALAGHAAEEVMDLAWEDLLQREVLAPLGITTAGFGAPGKPDSYDQPRGHRTIDGALVAMRPGPLADNPAGIGPAGTLHMSLSDWALFIRLHLRGARGESGLLLTPETFRRLHEPAEGQDEAAGWAVLQRSWAKGDEAGDTGRVLMFRGSNTMWACCVWAAPEKGFAVLATTNVGGDAAWAACDAAVSALLLEHAR